MAEKNTPKADAKGDKPKRKSLTPAERIAKLEAELAAAKGRAEEKAAKAAANLKQKIDAKVARRDKLNLELTAMMNEYNTLVGKDEAAAEAESESSSGSEG